MAHDQMIARDGDPLEIHRSLAGDPHRPLYHFLPPDIPWGNVVAFFEAVDKYGQGG